MPTVSEPTWRDIQERAERVIKEFVEAKHFSVDDSADVLRARLFAYGLRGDDLKSAVRLAEEKKREYRTRQVSPGGKSLDYYAASVTWLKDRRK